jgi:CDP-glucose 4,6-dehydratase
MKKKFSKLYSTFNGKKVLVTGHTGFKGSWLCAWLKMLNADVVGLSLNIPTNPSHFETSNLGASLFDHRADIKNSEELQSLIKQVQPDFIFHLAAQALVRKSYENPLETWHSNTMGTINLLESLKCLKKSCNVVIITSDKCYDNVEWVWGYRETDILGGSDPYSASKAAAELAIRSYQKSYFASGDLIKIAIGRAGNVIGGGDWAEDRIVPDCVKSWANGEVVELRKPESTRPWQHVLEPLAGYLNLAIHLDHDGSIHGEAFNFGPSNSSTYSVEELVVNMANYWDKVQWRKDASHDGGFRESSLLKLNCDKAMHFLGWKSVWDFEETVKQTVIWYRNYYKKPQYCTNSYTSSQILYYMESAHKQGLPWTR